MSPIPQPIADPLPDPVANPSPNPTGDHYDSGAPLDGGSNPSNNLGNSHEHSYSPTGLEIGVITGIIVVVIITVVGIFAWRNRRHRNAKNMETTTSADGATHADDASGQSTKAHEAGESASPPKEDRDSIGRHSPIATERSVIGWSHWAGMRHGDSAGHVEEHEIANRFRF
ncbi:hypothetical protein F5Y04DRAFT_292650 [Hypomontagnella monticulosa]|nr:hypothetical protein F5Y04DRAFT_292650 [Hypomontagnella monticulosa]